MSTDLMWSAILDNLATRYEGAIHHVETFGTIALSHPEITEDVALEIFDSLETCRSEREEVVALMRLAAQRYRDVEEMER